MSTQTFAPNPFGTPTLPGTLGPTTLSQQTAAVIQSVIAPTVPAKAPQNERELATQGQADALVAYLNSRFPASAAVVAAYVPAFFGTPAPSDGDYKFLHLSFANGAAGLNVGLIIDLFSRYPLSPGYVLHQLATEIGTQSA